MEFKLVAAHSNTGNCTVAIGTNAYTIVQGGVALYGGEILQGWGYHFMITPQGASLIGSSAGAVNVGNATSVFHAINQTTGDGRYAKLAGNAAQVFNAANASGGNNVLNIAQADGRYAALAGTSAGSFYANDANAAAGQIGVYANGYNPIYLENDSTNWGLYSAAGGYAIYYSRSQNEFVLGGNNVPVAAVAGFSVGTTLNVGGAAAITGTLNSGAFSSNGTINSNGNIVANSGLLRAGKGATGTGDGAAACLLADFANELANTGFQVLPTGVIVQWGFVAGLTGTSGTISFPKQFGTSCKSLTLTDNGASCYSYGAYPTAADHFTWYSPTAASHGFNWSAIGF